MGNLSSDGSGKILKIGAAQNPVSYASLPKSGLIMHLDAGDAASYPGSGTTWTDLSGVGNNGTLINTPTYVVAHYGFFNLNGSDEYATLPTNFFTHNNGDPCSVSIWFNTSGTGVILGQQDTATVGNASGWVPGIYVGTDGKLRTSIYWGGSTGNQQTTTEAVNNGKWKNITVTFASGVQKSYINGVAFGGSLAKTQTFYSAVYYYYVGSGRVAGWPAAPASPYFNGSISGLLYYNRELTAVDAKSIYNTYRGRYGV